MIEKMWQGVTFVEDKFPKFHVVLLAQLQDAILDVRLRRGFADCSGNRNVSLLLVLLLLLVDHVLYSEILTSFTPVSWLSLSSTTLSQFFFRRLRINFEKRGQQLYQ